MLFIDDKERTKQRFIIQEFCPRTVGYLHILYRTTSDSTVHNDDM